MRPSRSTTLLVIAGLLARQGSSLDLRLDIAGGSCQDIEEFDATFDDGVMPGTREVMDITTTTQREDAEKVLGFSAFQGGSESVSNNSSSSSNSSNNTATDDDISERDQDGRDLQLLMFDCPIYKECPGAGDPTHWCTWICGYWYDHSSPNQRDRDNVDGTGLRMLRRVTQDLQIPDAELEPILSPILYTHEDRELLISIEGLVCGWVQRWLDSRFSRCLNGAQVLTCELDLRS